MSAGIVTLGIKINLENRELLVVDRAKWLVINAVEST